MRMITGLSKPWRRRVLAVALLALAALLAGGILILAGRAADSRVRETEAAMRTRLLMKTQRVVSAINPVLAAGVAANPTDTSAPGFVRIAGQMRAMYRQDTASVEWVYVMTEDERGIVFGPDNSIPEEDGYGTAGQVYDDAPPEARQCFRNREAVVSAPYTDKWGTYVSAFVPLLDRHTGKVIVTVGMDVPLRVWEAQLRPVRNQPYVIALCVIACLLGGGLLVHRHNRRQRPERLHLKTWIVAPVALVGGLAILSYVAYEFNRTVAEIRNETTRVTSRSDRKWAQMLAAPTALIGTQTNELTADRRLIAAWQTGDRAQLRALLENYRQQWRERDIGQLALLAPDGTVVWPLAPDGGSYGRVDHKLMRVVRATGEDAWGIVPVGDSPLAYRYLRPWRVDGRLLGYVDAG
ncbi:MAG TPA: hypothetical protein PKM88_03970, partial [bacterium]|nr:hypothetical protein [bacterium]